MDAPDDIIIEVINGVGRIRLNRPKALNALTYDMVVAIDNALDEWVESDLVDLIIIDGEGDRAFCAGGDIARLYETGRAGEFSYGQKFWADEYRLNAKIANLAIPYIAIMDGITMGGGVGISVHGSDRIVTERSIIAMPECGIGLVPDVGGSLILAQSPGHVGEYLAMTGYRMGPGDAVFAGFGDVEMNGDKINAMLDEIVDSGDVSILGKYVRPADPPKLAEFLEAIDHHFSKPNAMECLTSLESDDSPWACKTIEQIRHSCPLSVACAFEIIRRVRKMPSIEEALKQEYRFTYRSMREGEFLEGIRAQIIDKDRMPNWKTKRLEDVMPDQIEAMLASLGADELNLSGGI